MTKNQIKIEQIHKEFNTAGETLLAEAKAIINNKAAVIQKAERLKAAGFSQANEVIANEDFFVSQETVSMVEYYSKKYPFNKFITRDQVLAINKKYNLVAAPIERYKGFVPDKNLKQIEAFRVNEDDIAENTYKVKFNPYADAGAVEAIKKMFPDLIVSKDHFFATTGGGAYAVIAKNPISGLAALSKYEEIDNRTQIICAPLKDMDVDGLKQKDSIFSLFKTVHVPDPVVLQPVKHGYLIVTAWGDESSDEIVVNSINN